MKNVDKKLLAQAASSLMFEMNDKELDTLLEEFNIILKQMELIGKIDGVDSASPMTFPFDVSNSFLREDEPTAPLVQEDSLKNASDVVDGQIRLPKVVG